MTDIQPLHWSFIVFVIGVVFLCVFMLTVPQLLGGRSWAKDKHLPFESGVDSVGGARIRLSAKFYLVAIFFVIFDIEALFLYAWAVSIRESGWLGFIEAIIFIAVLLVGLIYIWRIGALDWSPSQRNKAKTVSNQTIDLAQITQFIPIDILELDPTGKVPAQLSGRVNQSNHSQTKE